LRKRVLGRLSVWRIPRCMRDSRRRSRSSDRRAGMRACTLAWCTACGKLGSLCLHRHALGRQLRNLVCHIPLSNRSCSYLCNESGIWERGTLACTPDHTSASHTAKCMSAHTMLRLPELALALMPLVLSQLLILSSLLPVLALSPLLILSSLLPVQALHPASYACQRLPAMAPAMASGLQLHHSFAGKDWRRRKEGSELRATALLRKSAFLHGT